MFCSVGVGKYNPGTNLGPDGFPNRDDIYS